MPDPEGLPAPAQRQFRAVLTGAQPIIDSTRAKARGAGVGKDRVMVMRLWDFGFLP